MPLAHRVPAFEPRVAGDAFLGRAGIAVVHRLLVGTRLDAFPVAAAALLIDQDDSVLLALVDRLAWAGGEARGVAAVIADSREVEEERLVLRKLGAALRHAVL